MIVTEMKSDLDLLSRPMRNLIIQLKAEFGFIVVETGRSLDRQKWLKSSGKSQTLKSKHLIPKDGTGANAADVRPSGGYASWDAGKWNKAHDYWDRLCMDYHDHDWVVMPEKRISWDLGHFGITRKKRIK